MFCIDFRYEEKPFQRNKYPFSRTDHDSQNLGVSNHISLHDIVSGYHQMIPLQINQIKDFFKFPWDSCILKQIPPRLKDTGDTFRRTMFPVFNFFTMVYIDDIIICFKNDKEYLFYLKKICNKNTYGKQELKVKHQGEHDLFEKSWRNPYTMFVNENNYDLYSKKLNGQKVLGDLFEDRMLKYHYCKDSQL